MKKMFKNTKVKKLSALIAAFLAAIILPASAIYAWGPDRETFTIQKPASFITFNSITNNPKQGDERGFLRVKESTAPDSAFGDKVSLVPGKEYTVYVYYHNNAAENYNLVALNTYAKVEIPSVVKKGSDGTKSVGYVGASNAKPTQVWDDIEFANKTNADIALRYIPGSATIHNFGATNGAKISDQIVGTGAPLGYNSLNGELPGCNQYAGYVIFNVKAEQPNFEVVKQVRKSGTTAWAKSIKAKPGDKLDYQIEYKNTGTVTQDNVVLVDKLPTGLSFVAGSTKLKNVAYTTPKTMQDGIAKDGLNIGSYTAGSNAFVLYSVTVDNRNDLVCTLKNRISAVTKNGTKTDSATVDLGDACDPKKPVDPEECKPGIPNGDPRCEDATVPGGTTPSELPRTGPVEIVLTIVAVALIVLGGAYWYARKHKGSKKGPKQFIATEETDLDTPEEDVIAEVETITTDAPEKDDFKADETPEEIEETPEESEETNEEVEEDIFKNDSDKNKNDENHS